MGDEQKITLTITAEDGSQISRTHITDSDSLYNTNWSATVESMVETLASSKLPI